MVHVKSNEFCYKPLLDNHANTASVTITMNGKPVPANLLPLHPVTNTNKPGARPRHCASSVFVDKYLRPTVVNPDDGDAQEIRWRTNGTCSNYVFFASQSSLDRDVRKMYEIYRENRHALALAYQFMPEAAKSIDDLAGGKCTYVSVVSVPPGSEGCSLFVNAQI